MLTKHDMKLPTKRDINEILGVRCEGYNDKRSFGNRIKLLDRLSLENMIKLEKGLAEKFKHLNILVTNIRTTANYWSGSSMYVCTAIYADFKTKYELQNA